MGHRTIGRGKGQCVGQQKGQVGTTINSLEKPKDVPDPEGIILRLGERIRRQSCMPTEVEVSPGIEMTDG